MKYNLSTIFFWIIISSPALQAQNYLFDPGKYGISGGVGLFAREFNTIDAHSFHIEYTIYGRTTIGLNRTFIKRGSNSTGFSISHCIIKKQNGNNTFNLPLILGIST